MANLHSAFKAFDDNLKLTPTKENDLETARNALTKSLKKQFQLKNDYSAPKFWTQGSFQMKTAIRTEDDHCDLDLGMYFNKIPNLENSTIQSHVVQAIKNHTGQEPNHKSRCVRVNYAAGFHIDLPIYYMTSGMMHPELLVKGEARQQSDPKEFYEWFNKQCKNQPQKRRLIRYLKAWADSHKSKMPSGLALTVLAIQNYVKDDRDDLALLNTVLAVKHKVSITWSCILPACPNDDVLNRLDFSQKQNFINSLGDLYDGLKDAIDHENESASHEKCKRLFGKRFPDSPKTKRLIEKAALIASGKHHTSSTGTITESGVKNKPHKFYGE